MADLCRATGSRAIQRYKKKPLPRLRRDKADLSEGEEKEKKIREMEKELRGSFFIGFCVVETLEYQLQYFYRNVNPIFLFSAFLKIQISVDN